jgi:hypothetical protein
MTAADTPPVVLLGGPEEERRTLKGYLERNRIGVLAEATNPSEALPSLAQRPDATLVFLHPSDLTATASWLTQRREQGFTGRVGVIVQPARISELVGPGRFNDFALKSPVSEPDLCGAARSASRIADRG